MLYYSDSGVGRWTVASEDVGPIREQAKALGLTLKRNGRMRRYYDSAGKLRMAYSYNTCILAYVEPTEDFPNGRYVVNLTSYSMTSNRHVSEVFSEISPDQWCAPWSFGVRTPTNMVLRQVIDMYEIDEETDHKELLADAMRADRYERIAQAGARERKEREEKRAAKREQRAREKMRATGLRLVKGGVA